MNFDQVQQVFFPRESHLYNAILQTFLSEKSGPKTVWRESTPATFQQNTEQSCVSLSWWSQIIYFFNTYHHF